MDAEEVDLHHWLTPVESVTKRDNAKMNRSAKDYQDTHSIHSVSGHRSQPSNPWQYTKAKELSARAIVIIIIINLKRTWNWDQSTCKVITKIQPHRELINKLYNLDEGLTWLKLLVAI